MKIGVLLPNWVGDLVMATPTLRALRRSHPAAEITCVARPHLLPLLDGSEWVDRRLAWEHHGRGCLTRTAQTIQALRRERLDLLLVLRNSAYAAAVARACGARHSIGYARRGAGWLLHQTLSPPRAGRKLVPISAVDYYLQLAYAAGCRQESRWLDLATTPADERAADAIWQRLRLPDASRVVLLNTGGAYGSAKHWPREHSALLARRLANEQGLAVVVLCGPNERREAAAIAQAAGHPRVTSMAGEDVGFGATKGIIRRARILITTDSGPRHIAAALGTPTVTLLGPIDPAWSENYQPGAVHLRLPLECAPCGRRVCPLGHHRCLTDLTPDLVLRAVVGKLQTREAVRAA